MRGIARCCDNKTQQVKNKLNKVFPTHSDGTCSGALQFSLPCILAEAASQSPRSVSRSGSAAQAEVVKSSCQAQ